LGLPYDAYEAIETTLPSLLNIFLVI